jgi:hypothetical protein
MGAFAGRTPEAVQFLSAPVDIQEQHAIRYGLSVFNQHPSLRHASLNMLVPTCLYQMLDLQLIYFGCIMPAKPCRQKIAKCCVLLD